MNRTESTMNKDDRLLARTGGRYIQLVTGSTQAISLLIGLPVGLFITLITAKLNTTQTIQFLISLAALLTLANLLPLFISGRVTRQAREHLDHVFKNHPLPDGFNVNSAWEEIISLPGKVAISQCISAILIVLIPVVVLMKIVAGVNGIQLAAIAVGSLLIEMTILIQSVLSLDNRLAPVRTALLPVNEEPKRFHLGIGMATRQYFFTSFIILAALFTAGLVAYTQFNSAMVPGANIPTILGQLPVQLGISGTLIFILGFFLALRLFQASSRPVQEMNRTMEAVKSRDLTQRAVILTSDETAQLAIRLNLVLDQLQASQTGLEKQIEQRTGDLARKTSYLQAAALVAHEAAGLQDINTLLAKAAELISSRFGFYHVGIFLLDDTGEHAVLQAASSEGGRRMLARGHRLDVGVQGIVGATAFLNRPHVVMDVENDRDFQKNPDLPATRSEAAFTLNARGKILGVLDIQSTELFAFRQDDIELLQTMADQIGLALQNARLIAESQDAFKQLETTTSENIRRIWRERLHGNKHSYRYTSSGITSATQLGNMPTITKTTSDQLNIPITLRGQPLGTIMVRRSSENAWSETERSLAIEIASQVGLALENARLLDEAQRRAAQEQSLGELAVKLSRSLDMDVLLQTTIRELHQLPNISGVSVYLTPSEKTTTDNEN